MEAATVLAILKQDFSKCFTTKHQPLMLGIHHGLRGHYAKNGKLVYKDIKAAIGEYVNNPVYLANVQVGVERIDLLGEPCGEIINEKTARYAARKLARLTTS